LIRLTLAIGRSCDRLDDLAIDQSPHSIQLLRSQPRSRLSGTCAPYRNGAPAVDRPV